MSKKPISVAEFLLYQTEDGQTCVEVRMEGETVWLSLGQMAELFGRDKSVISRHVRNLFEEGELRREGTVANFATVQSEGSRSVGRDIEHYNLDVISVGYRVKSHRGTQFRIWATQRLREYLIKGFAMDDERLKAAGSGRYFDELLARIATSAVPKRCSDARCSTSTPPASTTIRAPKWPSSSSPPSRTRCTGPPTAIRRRNSSTNAPMPASSTWASLVGKPHGHARPTPRSPRTICPPKRSTPSTGLVNLYLEFAETQAMRRRPMTMADWIAKLDDFPRISEYEILDHAGRISNDAALRKAHLEFEKYQKSIIDLPSPVEKHFEEAVSKSKRLAKTTNEKSSGGKK